MGAFAVPERAVPRRAAAGGVRERSSARPGRFAVRSCSKTNPARASGCTPISRLLPHRDDPTSPAVDAVRRALVQTLRHGDRGDLVRELDRALLGVGDTSHLRLAS